MRHGYAPREKGPGASKTDFEPHLHVRHVCAVGDVARLACWSCLRECSCAVSHGASDHMVQGALALTNIFVNERLSDHVRQAMRRIYIYIYMCKSHRYAPIYAPHIYIYIYIYIYIRKTPAHIQPLPNVTFVRPPSSGTRPHNEYTK